MLYQISSAGNMMSTMQNALMQRQPPPQKNDTFEVADTNQDEVVSEEELEETASSVAELTDTDGGPNGEELLQMLSNYNIAMLSSYKIVSTEITTAPENGEGTQPVNELLTRALEEYTRNSGNNSTTNLIELLNKGTDDNSGNVNLLDIEV